MKPLIFAEHAHGLRDAGLAVIPLASGLEDIGDRAGKKPLVTGFERWSGRPSQKTVDGWCKKFPDMNVGYVPGASDLVMVDDDGGAAEAIVDAFGDTPGKIATRRGGHYLYRKPRAAMPEVVDLRKFGLNADLKHGNTIAVAPPSIHKSGHVYAWQDCGPDVLKELPVFPLAQLARLIESRAGMTQTEKKAAAGFRSASRRQGLNDHLCKHASWCDTFGELIDCARTWVEEQCEKGIDRLEDIEIMEVSHSVWKAHEAGKLERWHGRKATIKTNTDEIAELAKFGKDAPQAYMLLIKLRGEHGGRMNRGETFALNQIAMAKAGTIAFWSRYDYEKARAILLKAGKIEIAEAAKLTSSGKKSVQFRLTSSDLPGA